MKVDLKITKTINLRAALLLVLTFLICGGYASAQKNDKFKVPKNPINLNPLLEWKSFGETTGSDGKTYLGLTFAVANWNVFSDAQFAAAADLPACGLNKNSSQTWLDIFNYETGKRIYGFCGLKKSEDMKSLSFNVKREQLPNCVYITLTDRRAGKTVKSNPIKFVDGKNELCKEKPQITIK